MLQSWTLAGVLVGESDLDYTLRDRKYKMHDTHYYNDREKRITNKEKKFYANPVRFFRYYLQK